MALRQSACARYSSRAGELVRACGRGMEGIRTGQEQRRLNGERHSEPVERRKRRTRTQNWTNWVPRMYNACWQDLQHISAQTLGAYAAGKPYALG